MGIDGYKTYSSWQLCSINMYSGYLSYTSPNGKFGNELSRGKLKAIKKEMDKTRKINIPLSAFDVQIVRSSNNWYLKYNVSHDEVEEIMIGKPCDIKNISKHDDKHCVEVNLYSIEEYMNL